MLSIDNWNAVQLLLILCPISGTYVRSVAKVFNIYIFYSTLR